eukprot:GFUD01027674.1.p1 GENE.GFUD01027674.1~~GFUD01027674.1.p1  ORF type:complete len:223 (+),score=68.70 GFUD01027674.1:62-670(+)
MGWTAPPAAPQCPACKTSVFPAESFMAADRKPFHKKCVKCKTCSKALNSSSINEHQTQLYCQACYDNLFMAQDYTCGKYGGIVTPEDIKRREEEERKKKERAERQKSERRCPGCDMKAYPEDSVCLNDLHYHKACLKCTECGRNPDDNTPMVMGPNKDVDDVFGDEDLQPFCKFCFAKKFKISALNIAETVTTVPECSAMGL